jgi:hypothetical protein
MLSVVRFLPLVVLGCVTPAKQSMGPERRPPDMVIAGAMEVGESSNGDAVTHDNYADCMVRCRHMCIASDPILSSSSDHDRCESLVSPCWSDCQHRYLK